MKHLLFLSLVVVGLSACGFPPPEFEHLTSGAVATTSAGVEQQAVPGRIELRFGTETWTPVASEPLYAGAQVEVVYDSERLPQCRGDFGGKPGWSIWGSWKLAGKHGGKDSGSFPVAGLDPSSGSQPPVIPLTQPGELEVWFQVSSRWGCNAYDSNLGANYKLPVAAEPVPSTDADE